MSKKGNKKKKKKQNKPYYSSKSVKTREEKIEDYRKKTFFSTIFTVCLGFIVLLYSRYLVIPFSKYTVAIVGLSIIGYGSYKSLLISLGKEHNSKGELKYSKSNVIFDISKLVIITLIIIFCIYNLIITYI